MQKQARSDGKYSNNNVDSLVINVTPTLAIDSSSVLHLTTDTPVSAPLVLESEDTSTCWDGDFGCLLLIPAAGLLGPSRSSTNELVIIRAHSWS